MAGAACGDAQHSHASEVDIVSEIVASTTVEWSAAFAKAGKSYAPPRLIGLAPERGHPASGSGYARGLLILDRRELDDIQALFSIDGAALTGLLIAHEVGHHIQWRNDPEIHHGRPTTSHELEADCAAGWWLAAANTRALREQGHVLFAVPDLERQFPRLITAITMLGGHVDVRGMPAAPIGHGTLDQRIRALRYGLAVKDVGLCGRSVTP